MALPLQKPKIEQQRGVIRFLTAEEVKPADSTRRLVAVNGKQHGIPAILTYIRVKGASLGMSFQVAQ